MDIKERVSEITARLDGAMPTKYEQDFEHEIWFIHHLEEIIKGYREDVPWLMEQVTDLYEQRNEMLEVLLIFKEMLAPEGDYSITRSDGEKIEFIEAFAVECVFERADKAIAKARAERAEQAQGEGEGE